LNRHPVAIACALCAALSGGLLAATTALAQDMPVGEGADSQPRPANARLDRVELSSRPQSDTELRRRAPVAKQIYGREELDKYGDQSVVDVLKRLPGVNVAGGAPRMRGLGAGYTLILINGDPAPPGFQLDQLDPAQVERIEVTKGPSADQSAQAVAGAINIILKEAPRFSQRDLRLALRYNAERPVPALTFTFGERLGPVSVALPLSAFEWRGRNEWLTERFMPGTDEQPARITQVAQQEFWGHGFNSAPRLTWKLNDEETLNLQGFAQRGYWHNRSAYLNSGVQGQPTFDDDSFNHGTFQMLRGNLQYNNRFSDSQRIELKAGGLQAKNTFDNKTFRGGADRRVARGDNEDRNLTQAGKYSQLLGDAHSLTVGWDLEWRERDEQRTVTENGLPQLPEFEGQPFSARIERQAFFIQDEWEIAPQWSTYLGLRSERIHTESRGAEARVSNTSRVTTPVWHLNYKLDPKGRDLIRASLTRSYKAPELNALLDRPSLNGLYPDPTRSNTELSPDRGGNPTLKPELATGLDLAFEKYLAGGGMISVGVFHRSVKDLIRNITTLETVDWATAPRWVSRPVNFSKASTSGLELEIKGRAGELLPAVFDPKLALNLRGSLSFYRSRVEALDGPNNRLDGQQPWSGNMGFDYRLASLPLTTGLNLGYTPGYTTRQTSSQSLEQSRTRSLDVFAQLNLSRTTSLRASANNFVPLDTQSRTLLASGYGSRTEREGRTWFALVLDHKL
jgi:iron complex outermembrane receptor protein